MVDSLRFQPEGCKLHMGQKRFPLNMVPALGGWYISIELENGQSTRLLKPGRDEDHTRPYLFPSQQDAWAFIKELFYFCIRQEHAQCNHSDKIINCKQCNRVFRARIFDYCPTCLKENEFMIEQIWQGFYFITGSEANTKKRIALLLKISDKDYVHMPEAFKTVVQRQLALHNEMEERSNKPEQKLSRMLKAKPGLHLTKKTKSR